MQMRTATQPWLRTPERMPAGVRLFCLPYAGGGTAIFRGWQERMPAIQVCPVQLPGRERRLAEPPLTRLHALVDALAHGLRPWLDAPFALFGHSMGALIGFELARYLRRRGWPAPAHLLVSGRRAPQLADPRAPIHQLPQREFIQSVRQFNGTPDIVWQHAELLQLVLPILRADFALCETYCYAADSPLDCPITAFGSTDDPMASYAELAPWRDQTRQAFTLRVFPGDHFFLHSAQQALTGAVCQALGHVPAL